MSYPKQGLPENIISGRTKKAGTPLMQATDVRQAIKAAHCMYMTNVTAVI